MPASVPKEYKKETARRIRKLMTEQGMSQSDLARAIYGETKDPRGFLVARNRDRISQWLNGRSLPDPANTLKIAKVFGVTPEEIVPYRPGYAEPGPPEVNMELLPSGEVKLMVNKVVPRPVAMDILKTLATSEV